MNSICLFLLRMLSKIQCAISKSIFSRVACDCDKITIGPDCCRNFHIAIPEMLKIGNGTAINGDLYVHALGGVTIGCYCHIGRGLTIFSHNHNWRSLSHIPYDSEVICRPVEIGDAVWIGANVTIMPGTTIGNGAIIGGGSVLRGEIPAGAIVMGNPASIVGSRDMELFKKLYLQGKFN